MSKGGAVKDAPVPAKEGLGEPLFDPKEKAKVEYGSLS